NRTGHEAILIKMLSDENPDVRLLAAEKLGGEGITGTNRAFALVPLLNDEHQSVRREAAWSLGTIGLAAWPAFEHAFQNPNQVVRREALWGLCQVYSPKVEYWPSRNRDLTLPVVEKLLEDSDASVREAAAKSLKRIKGPAGPYGAL